MKRILIKTKLFGFLFFVLMVASCAGIEGQGGVLSRGGEISSQVMAQAVKEALQLSVQRATNTLSQDGAYLNSDQYHIAYPGDVQDIISTLQKFGLSGPLDSAEQAVNKAAALAASEAETVMLTAIDNMTITDVMGLVKGGDNAATAFFEQVTRQDLGVRYDSILKQKLESISFYPSYRKLLSTYKALPIPNKPDIELENHAVQKGLDALYSEMAKEEVKIRNNPKEQGSLIISSVFGG